MTTPNIAELDALLNWAEAEHAKKLRGEPSEWDQIHWAVNPIQYARYWDQQPPPVDCGTACCLAGKAVARQGGVFKIGRDGVAAYADMPDGKTVAIDDYAQQILGLSEHQADTLFEGYNTIEDVRKYIQEIKDGDL